MDWSYESTAKRNGFAVDKNKGDDLLNFPIEEACTYGSTWLLPLSAGVVAGYGWVINQKVHVAAPLILQCLLGFLVTWFSQLYNVLLVDSK